VLVLGSYRSVALPEQMRQQSGAVAAILGPALGGFVEGTS
jgi:hypothetical protein